MSQDRESENNNTFEPPKFDYVKQSFFGRFSNLKLIAIVAALAVLAILAALAVLISSFAGNTTKANLNNTSASKPADLTSSTKTTSNLTTTSTRAETTTLSQVSTSSTISQSSQATTTTTSIAPTTSPQTTTTAPTSLGSSSVVVLAVADKITATGSGSSKTLVFQPAALYVTTNTEIILENSTSIAITVSIQGVDHPIPSGGNYAFSLPAGNYVISITSPALQPPPSQSITVS